MKLSKTATQYLFIAPSIGLIALTLLYPLIYAFKISLTDLSLFSVGTSKFVGLKNYISLSRDPVVFYSLWITAYFTLLAVGVELIFGFATALLLNRELKGMKVFRVLLIVPLMVSPAISAILWRWLYTPHWGLLNYFIELLGGQGLNWLGSRSLVLFSLALVDIWRNTPFVTLVLLAGLQSLPKEPIEAAIVDGASNIQLFRLVTLPLMKNVILVVVLFRTVACVAIFDIVYILTRGGPGRATETIAHLAFKKGLVNFDLGMASAIGYVIFAISCVISIVTISLMRGRK